MQLNKKINTTRRFGKSFLSSQSYDKILTTSPIESLYIIIQVTVLVTATILYDYYTRYFWGKFKLPDTRDV